MLPTAAGATSETKVAASWVRNVRIQRTATGARLVMMTVAARYVAKDARSAGQPTPGRHR